jgi:hypothetical protein
MAEVEGGTAEDIIETTPSGTDADAVAEQQEWKGEELMAACCEGRYQTKQCTPTTHEQLVINLRLDDARGLMEQGKSQGSISKMLDACVDGRLDEAQRLLEEDGCDVNSRNAAGRSAFLICCTEGGSLQLTDFLFSPLNPFGSCRQLL